MLIMVQEVTLRYLVLPGSQLRSKLTGKIIVFAMKLWKLPIFVPQKRISNWEREFRKAVSQGVKKRNLTSSLDELTTALAAVEQEQKQAADLKNDPPEIIYMDKPALLVVIDGKTMLQKIEKSDYQAVANTPYPLFFEDKSGNWFLNAADNVWYSAKKDDGPWTYTDQPPAVLVKMVASKSSEDKSSENKPETEKTDTKITAENAPAIVVAHKPTELVVSTGNSRI